MVASPFRALAVLRMYTFISNEINVGGRRSSKVWTFSTLTSMLFIHQAKETRRGGRGEVNTPARSSC